eukprot:SAG22_NODE_5158_length_1074_cov_3.284740_2_plen_26_part_01
MWAAGPGQEVVKGRERDGDMSHHFPR